MGDNTKSGFRQIIAGLILIGAGIPGIVYAYKLVLTAISKDPDVGVTLFNLGCFLGALACISVIVGTILFGVGLNKERKRGKRCSAYHSRSNYNETDKS